MKQKTDPNGTPCHKYNSTYNLAIFLATDSIRTFMQNLESVAQKMAELLY